MITVKNYNDLKLKLLEFKLSRTIDYWTHQVVKNKRERAWRAVTKHSKAL